MRPPRMEHRLHPPAPSCGAVEAIYCHDGFRMHLGWLQLKSLGYQDVRVLDGGWGIWDRAVTLPVVAGENPYDKEFAL